MNAKPRILVTGSAGFIGSNVLSKLRNLGYPVLGVDNYSNYYSTSMKIQREASLGLEGLTRELDISDFESFKIAFESIQPNIVINLAAQGGVRASRTNPAPYLISNQLGFLNTLTLSKMYGVSKFIYASSSSVYGDSTESPFRENSILPAPKSLYALSKISNEIMAENFDSPDMQKFGLRFFTVYGPWGRPDMAMFRILASARLGKDFQLTASPSVKRDFTFVDDVTSVLEAIFRLDSKSGIKNEIINVAGGNPYSLADLFNILENLGQKMKIVQNAPDELDVKLTHGSVDKLASLSLPIPNTSLLHGVEKTMEWINRIDENSLSEWFDYHF